MKNKSYIGISLIILVFGIIFIPKIIDRVKKGEVVQNDRMSADNPEIKGTTEDSGDLAYIEQYGKRKHIPDFKFVNQNGDTITNKDYLGKVYVVEFFFSTCPSICPIMNENLVEVDKEFEGNDDFGIVSITIDPMHDTPQVLKEYKEAHDIQDPQWNFLTGNTDTIYNLANKGFGVYAGKDKNAAGGFAHSGLFALIDKEGYFRSRKDAYGNPILYYRGSIKRGTSVAEGDNEPQIDELIKDIHKLL